MMEALIDNLQELLFSMAARRSERKMERYETVKNLLSTILPPIDRQLQNAFNQREPYLEFVNYVVTAWQASQKKFPASPSRFPSETLFQEFALSLHSHSKGTLSEKIAFDLGAWLEEKFTTGKHPFWSRFLESAVLRPCNIDSKKILPAVFLPTESILHSLDDYIDTKHAAPSQTILDLGLAVTSLILLPLLFKSSVSLADSKDGYGLAISACRSFYSAFEDAIKVPQVEDDTPENLREARGDIKDEIEAAAFNIDFRTRATTGVFLRPLSSMFPHHAENIQIIWEMLWLARATEMCAKDAVFDVEADILNQDYTPASVWAEDFGVGTTDWCKRINALYTRYLELWSSRLSERSMLPDNLLAEIETRVHKNRFLIESLMPTKEIHLPTGLRNLKKVYMVGSGKGGVGKSTVSWLIANGLRDLGSKVGVIDADIWGPSQNLLFERDGRVCFDSSELIPEEREGITLVTLGQFVAQNDAILVRSVVASNLLKQLTLSVHWPELDYLIIDLPPGNSDIHIQLCSIFPQAEIILVTLPQPLAIADTSRTMSIYTTLNKKVRGLILNMTGILCDNCGEESSLGNAIDNDNWHSLPLGNVPLLACLPFDINLVRRGYKDNKGIADNQSTRLYESIVALTRNLIS